MPLSLTRLRAGHFLPRQLCVLSCGDGLSIYGTRKWIVVRAEAEGKALTASAILGDNCCSYRKDAGWLRFSGNKEKLVGFSCFFPGVKLFLKETRRIIFFSHVFVFVYFAVQHTLQNKPGCAVSCPHLPQQWCRTYVSSTHTRSHTRLQTNVHIDSDTRVAATTGCFKQTWESSQSPHSEARLDKVWHKGLKSLQHTRTQTLSQRWRWGNLSDSRAWHPQQRDQHAEHVVCHTRWVCYFAVQNNTTTPTPLSPIEINSCLVQPHLSLTTLVQQASWHGLGNTGLWQVGRSFREWLTVRWTRRAVAR